LEIGISICPAIRDSCEREYPWLRNAGVLAAVAAARPMTSKMRYDANAPPQS